MSEPPCFCNLLGLRRFSTPKSHALSNSPDRGLQEVHAPLHRSPRCPIPKLFLLTALPTPTYPRRPGRTRYPHRPLLAAEELPLPRQPLAWFNGVPVLGPFPRAVTPVGAHSLRPLPACMGSRFTILPQEGPKPAPPQVPRCCPSLAPGEARVSHLLPSVAAAAATTGAAATSVAHSAAPAKAALRGQA